jgi:hypothetical protein
MKISRLLVVSIIYNYREYLHSKGFTTDTDCSGFPYIKVSAKDQAYNQWSVPCIVVYPVQGYDKELQIGGGYWLHNMMAFDIYGASESQLLDLVDYTMEFVEHNSSVYRYDENAPTYQVSSGLVRTVFEGGSPERVCPIYFENRTVTFMDRVDTIGEARAHAAQLRTVATTQNTY